MKKLQPIEIYLLILLLSGCFQNIEIISITAGFSLKLFHVAALAGLPILISRRSLKMPTKVVTLFFVYIIAMSIIAYSLYKFNTFVVNYLFCFYALILVINIGKDVKLETWKTIVRYVAVVIMVAIFINLIVNYQRVIKFLTGGSERIYLKTIFGGGINLEATWIAMLGVFFIEKEKTGLIYIAFSMIISMLYSSRAGIIINALVLIFFFVRKEKGKSHVKRNIILVTIMSIFLVFIELKTQLISNILSRFLSIGDENGSKGRLDMWQYIHDTITKNPFGYGLGNAVEALQEISGKVFIENNVHNMFFQMLLDCGIIGFLYYLTLNVLFIAKEIKNVIKNPVVAFILLYIVISLIEFRGGEFIIYFMLGIYLQNKYYMTQKNVREEIDEDKHSSTDL